MSAEDVERLVAERRCWLTYASHTQAAQEAMRLAYLSIQGVPAAGQLLNRVSQTRTQAYDLELQAALQLYQVDQALAQLTKPDPRLAQEPWFVAAQEKLEGAVRDLAMHGFTGRVNFAGGTLDVPFAPPGPQAQ